MKVRDGLSYEDKVRCLNLQSPEERRNGHDMIEMFKMSKGTIRTRLQELFTLEDKNKGTRGY